MDETSTGWKHASLFYGIAAPFDNNQYQSSQKITFSYAAKDVFSLSNNQGRKRAKHTPAITMLDMCTTQRRSAVSVH